MDKKIQQKPKAEDDILRRPLYLYDLPPEVLATLALKSDAEAHEPSAPDAPKESAQSESADALVGSQACSLCNLSFNAVEEQRSHLKSDLHHYNLKQKLRGAKPVSEAEFETLLGNLDESLSGSESSESDEDEDDDENSTKKDSTLVALLKKQATLAAKHTGPSDDGDDGSGGGGGVSGKKRGSGKPPLLWFGSSLLPENSYFGMYRAIFTAEELAKEDAIMEAVKSRQLAPISMPKQAAGKDENMVPAAYEGRHMFLCMIGGGHFAAMVVSLAPRLSKHGPRPMNREAVVLAHKTMHRYTTRRKQGGAQSTSDAAKGAAHSAGSSLRRYNEQALMEDVRGLLRDWKGLLDTSDLLFIRATGTTNRRTLFGPYEGQVLRASDPRIRGFPFSTRRATQAELMRSFIELTRLKVREIIPDAATIATSPGKSTTPNPTTSKATAAAAAAKAKPKKLSEEEETALLHTSQIQALIRRSKLPALLAYLQNNSLPGDFRFQPAEAHHHAPTPLHLAASQGAAALVAGLVGRAGADPALRNADGRAPFELAGDRATRDAFRVARSELGEDRWRWDDAGVPAPMTRAEADRREARERSDAEQKEADRRRAEEERLKKEGVGATTAAAAAGAKSRPGLSSRVPAKTAQEVREEETRGMTPEQRMRLERERRARAAERRMQANNG